MRRKSNTLEVLLAAVIVSLLATAVSAEERTVVGRITRLDPDAGTLTVTDAVGKGWNFRVDEESGIDLDGLEVGERVEVTISRATPLNMMSAADILKKGDKVAVVGGY